MAASDPQTLFSEALCFLCYGVSQYQAVKLALLARISKNSSSANKTDPQSLLALANVSCFNCYGKPTLGQLFELALLKQISGT